MSRHAAALFVAALLLIATLFEPTVPARSGRVEHLVVLDITQSMNVADAAFGGRQVPRLVAAKSLLAEALVELPCGSKIGLGIFSEYRVFVLLAPLEVCGNRAELLATLRQIDGRMAWTGNSEVAKGLNSSLRASRELPGVPSVVFVSDGHEAPPIDARLRPKFDDAIARGELPGLIVGVGGDLPLPIPKSDPGGRPLGHWRADEVMQVDRGSFGRGGSVAGEAMVDSDDAATVAAAPLPGATPGLEHLSSLREPYLQLLAGETGLLYHRLASAEALLTALSDPALRREAQSLHDLRPWLGAAALAALLVGLGLPRLGAIGRGGQAY